MGDLVLRVFISGDPVAKGRHRVASVGGAPRIYTPAKTAKWEHWVAMVAADAMGSKPRFDGPVRLVIDVVLRRPKSRPKRDFWPDRRPDLDNYEKAVSDGLQKAGVWRDDAQVCQTIATKRYARGDEKIGIHVSVCPVGLPGDNASGP